MRSLSFNFPWVFNCFTMLNYPIINGKNEYFFNYNLVNLAKRSSHEEGTFYYIELNKIMRFFESFFSFSVIENEILERIVFESKYFKNLPKKRRDENYLVRYDLLLSLIRYSVLTTEGIYKNKFIFFI